MNDKQELKHVASAAELLPAKDDAIQAADNEQHKLINLTLLNGTGYVFEADDYLLLRRKHRILGAMVGSCSSRGLLVDEYTLPVELLPWEVALLLEQKIAQLVSKHAAIQQRPSAAQLQSYELEIADLETEQAQIMKLERVRDVQRNIKQIMLGKRRKVDNVQLAEAPNESELLQAAADQFVYDEKLMLVETACAHTTEHFGYICSMPSDRSLIYCVFRDCWLRGFYIMPGETFGADLLLYPGDPEHFHASHILILLQKPSQAALELIAKTRISVFVNKICVLAYFAQHSDALVNDWAQVQYQTVEWENSLDNEILNS